MNLRKSARSVYYTARLEDEDVAEKIRKNLLTSASIGLKVNKMSCSICGKAYGDPACHHLLGREYPNERLTEQARLYLDKPIGTIVGGDIEAKEQSIVLFPAIAGASVGFNFTEETNTLIERVEAKKHDLVQLSEADLQMMQLVMVNNGKVVLDRKHYEEITTNLENIKEKYATLEKVVWLYSNCDDRFIEETLPKIDSFDEKQLEFLWKIYQGMSNNFELQGRVASEEGRISSMDVAKEDIREVIFGVRRDGKLKGVRSIKDINILQ